MLVGSFDGRKKFLKEGWVSIFLWLWTNKTNLVLIPSLPHVIIKTILASIILPQTTIIGFEHSKLSKMARKTRKGKVLKVLMKVLYFRLSGLICVSEDVSKAFRRWLGPEVNLYTCFNPTGSGSDSIDGGIREQLPSVGRRTICGRSSGEQPPLKLLWAGRIVREKDPLILIQILRCLSDMNIPFSIQVCGEGELKRQLANELDRNGWSSVSELCGWVDDIHLRILSSDVVVSTSFSEGYGNVIAMAMLSRKRLFVRKQTGGLSRALPKEFFFHPDNMYESIKKTMEYDINKYYQSYRFKQLAMKISNPQIFTRFWAIVNEI